MAKHRQIEFFTTSVTEQIEWIQAFKPSVILLDLKEELVLKSLIGRGNFAKVHLCNRKGDPVTKYALKTMEK
jgi:hypothetical protein